MGGDRNAVTLICESGTESWAEMEKIEVARELASRIAQALNEPPLIKAAE